MSNPTAMSARNNQDNVANDNIKTNNAPFESWLKSQELEHLYETPPRDHNTLNILNDRLDRLPQIVHPKSADSIQSKLTNYTHSRTDSSSSFITNHTDLSFPMTPENNKLLLNRNLSNIIHHKNNKSLSAYSTATTSCEDSKLHSVINTPSQTTPSSLNVNGHHRRYNQYFNQFGNIFGSKLVNVNTNIKTTNNNNTEDANDKNSRKDNQEPQSQQLQPNREPNATDLAQTFKVSEWLKSMGITQYEEAFYSEGFDRLGAIIELNAEDLIDMKIRKGHAKMIMRQVDNLQKSLNIKPLNPNPYHARHHSNPEPSRNHRRTMTMSSHSMSHSDPVIPGIDQILADDIDLQQIHQKQLNEQKLVELETEKSKKSSDNGFPDIDDKTSRYIPDLHTLNVDDTATDIETVGYHTFDHTSTNATITPIIKTDRTPNTSAALASLRVAVPIQKPQSRSIPKLQLHTQQVRPTCLKNRVSTGPVKAPISSQSAGSTLTSSSSQPSFHPTNLNYSEGNANTNNNNITLNVNISDLTTNNPYLEHSLYNNEMFGYANSNSNVSTGNTTPSRLKHQYRTRQYHSVDNGNTNAAQVCFISDSSQDSGSANNSQRRHSIANSSDASNDYVLYQKPTQKPMSDIEEDNSDGDEGDAFSIQYSRSYALSKHSKRTRHHNVHVSQQNDVHESINKKKWFGYQRKHQKKKNNNQYNPTMDTINDEDQYTQSSPSMNGNKPLPFFLCGSKKNKKGINTHPKKNRNDDRDGSVSQSSTTRQSRKSLRSSKSKSKSRSSRNNKLNNNKDFVSLNYTEQSGDITPYQTASPLRQRHQSHHGYNNSYDIKHREHDPKRRRSENTYKEEMESKAYKREHSKEKMTKKQRNYSIALSMDAQELDIHSPSTSNSTKLLNEAKELHRNGNNDTAAELYARFLHRHCNDVDARIRYALCLLDLHEQDSAAKQLNLLLECDPRNGSNAMLHFVYGLLEHKRDNLDNASYHYSQALKFKYVYPDRVYNNLASLHRSCKDYRSAETYQLMALQIAPNNYIAYLNYAKILSDMGRYNEAIKAFEDAISLRSDLADLHVEFGLFLMEINKDYHGAKIELSKALDLSPDNSEIGALYKQSLSLYAHANGRVKSKSINRGIDNETRNRSIAIYRQRGGSKSDCDIEDDSDDGQLPDGIGSNSEFTLINMTSSKDDEENDNDGEHKQTTSMVYDILDEMNELKIVVPNKKHARRRSLQNNLPAPISITRRNVNEAQEQTNETISSSPRADNHHIQSMQYDCTTIEERSVSPMQSTHTNTNSSKQRKHSICEALPPPHNPRKPNDPVRRNSLINITLVECDENENDNDDNVMDHDDDAGSVVSDLSDDF